MSESTISSRALFELLPSPLQEDHYYSHPFPGAAHHRIARHTSGAPVFLLSVSSSGSSRYAAPISLEYISVEHGLICHLVRGDGTVEEGQFSSLLCTSSDPEIQAYFLEVVGPVIQVIGDHPSTRDINKAVQRLSELFRALKNPPRQSTQGLWAELYVMSRLGNPLEMAKAWRKQPEDRFDFQMEEMCLEVKSYSGLIRQHHFALEQLRPSTGEHVVVASLRVVRNEQGTALGDLVGEIRAHLEEDSMVLTEFDRTLALTLGSGLKVGMLECYDEKVARSSLALFEARDIPSVPVELPPEIGEVRFSVDLTFVRSLQKNGKHIDLCSLEL